MFSSSKRARRGEQTACIFVHAGAGFHSVNNEITHLTACNDAAKAAMAIMRNGGSAVDAVEMAIKCLEDREITNAGYGSNLAMDGVVECDAVVVDHDGRSGGAGAVAQIKNPISLARMLLDYSATQLSLRRVPPNFLVGQGATDFAWEHGMRIMPFEALVSPAAKERWRRWSQDLRAAERKARETEAARYGLSPPPSETDSYSYHHPVSQADRARLHYTTALTEGLHNDAQPLSPPPSDLPMAPAHNYSDPPSYSSSASSLVRLHDASKALPSSGEEYFDPNGPPLLSSAHPFMNSSQSVADADMTTQKGGYGTKDGSYYARTGVQSEQMDDLEAQDSYMDGDVQWRECSELADQSPELMSDMSASSMTEAPHSPVIPGFPEGTSSNRASNEPSPVTDPAQPSEYPFTVPLTGPLLTSPSEDNITDTVGAIAIDSYGNIACGASSGGIGMKHRGRIGPAALVGIGASVIPINPEDPDRSAVATVTSGTGEHMGTTMASSVCSDRIFYARRRTANGGFAACDEDEAVRAFIDNDFMGHPSVRNSSSIGAIGVLSVKSTKDGAFLFFAHNTDSFALASMCSEDAKPQCTMSRNKGYGSIAQGGKGYRIRKKR